MKSKNETVKQLIRELEAGKHKLLLEYKKGIRVLDDAIAALKTLELDTSLLISSKSRQLAGNKNIVLSELVGGKSGRRGRPVSDPENPGLTQVIFETVKKKRKFMHQRDIVALVHKQFPDEELSDFSKKVSVLLSALKKQGRIVSVKKDDSTRNVHWGLAKSNS
jgi:hypothetical protein